MYGITLPVIALASAVRPWSTGKSDDAAAPRCRARDLDGVLGRLGAGCQQDRLGGTCDRRQRIQPLAQANVRLVLQHLEAGVGEAVELSADRRHDMRMAMAGVEHGDAAGEVDIALALDIPDFAVEGTVGKQRRRIAHAPDDGFMPTCQQFLVRSHEARLLAGNDRDAGYERRYCDQSACSRRQVTPMHQSEGRPLCAAQMASTFFSHPRNATIAGSSQRSRSATS
ncbi:hypothetical protein ACVILH_005261 [Bradyrhizobium sp. USDA 4353]